MKAEVWYNAGMGFTLLPTGVPPGKRLFDLFLTVLALILSSPLMLGVALFIWLKDGRPVLFNQPRPGLNGRIFTLHKFRTMSNAVDAQGKPLPDTQRLQRWGRILRGTSLDELPEFFNVWMGEMSWVGPRPLLAAYLERYSPEQMRRHEVLPGITGWAQVNGRNAITWEQKFALDIWYVDHWSFWLDLKIILMTVGVVLRGKDVNHPGDRTEGEFMGDQNSRSGSDG
jgi:lipopolysaccharide/colanic/teichoic acid biosynthesis glycosyltransferase